MNKNTHQINLLLISISISVFLAILISIPVSSIAQERNENNSYMHKEVPDDPYLPMLPEDMQTSPAYQSRVNGFFTTQVNVDEDGYNILGDAANEPSIAIDPTDPNRIVIGWRQFDNVSSNFRQAGYGFSEDGGQTWEFPGSIDEGVFRSDPVLGVDNNGNFYYNSLTANDNDDFWCHVFKTEEASFDWDDGTFAQGGDKQWMQVDHSGGVGNGNIYAAWNASYSICWPGSFTRSTDEGASYQDCGILAGNPIWGTLTVGPDGEIYVVGAGNSAGLVVLKSITAQHPDSSIIWRNSVYVALDGGLSGWSQVNPAGLLGQAWVDVDRSDGPGRGNVYVLASVNRYSNYDPGDVMFSRSIDGGLSWEYPTRINTDIDTYPYAYQWFGTMSVAPNGRIDAVWLDTRDAPVGNSVMSELYYSYSMDQGVTWSENERLSEAFNPHVGWPNQDKMGDYFDMVSDNIGAHLAWANTINGEQDVYYGFINPLLVGIEDKTENNTHLSFINYPNPVSDKTTLRYELKESTMVVIELFDIYGNTVDVITNQVKEAGMHNTVFNVSGIARGVYFCRLTAGSSSETIKITLIN